MTIHAWSGYNRYAMGHDELRPQTQSPKDWYHPFSLQSTPIDSLDTLYIMNLTTEYNQAKNLILNINPITWTNVTTPISVFETTIRVLGGLLSAFELEGDERLLEKAVELADALLPAFETENGLPLNFLNMSNGVARDHGDSFHSVGLAEAGTLQLEFQYLSDITGNPVYANKSLFAFEQLLRLEKPVPGLFPMYMHTTSKDLMGGHQQYGIGGMSDSFYEYMLKLYLATGEERYFNEYEISAKAFIKHVATVTPSSKLTFMPKLTFLRNSEETSQPIFYKEPTMEHLSCFSGGLFALGGLLNRKKSSWIQQLDLGQKITETCVRMYVETSTGLGPEAMNVDNFGAVIAGYYLRPEVVESLFYLWRLTHDPYYREKGWEIAMALEKHCRCETGGYYGLLNVEKPSRKDDVMNSFFIAETLKYLYLLFTDDDTLPLEKYVFNTEAHPISVRGHGRRSFNSTTHLKIPISESDFGTSFNKLVDISEELKQKRKLPLVYHIQNHEMNTDPMIAVEEIYSQHQIQQQNGNPHLDVLNGLMDAQVAGGFDLDLGSFDMQEMDDEWWGFDDDPFFNGEFGNGG
ncbi:hypothetical protein HDU76_005757, partial [Blyttiomyces sp. JEL0837]